MQKINVFDNFFGFIIIKVMKGIEIKKGSDDKIIVSFPYNPAYIAKIKIIKGYR